MGGRELAEDQYLYLPKESWYVPLISLSFGQAFFTEDPRVGTGTTAVTPVATSHSYQVVAGQTLHKTAYSGTRNQQRTVRNN
jgi:hypothetical protein